MKDSNYVKKVVYVFKTDDGIPYSHLKPNLVEAVLSSFQHFKTNEFIPSHIFVDDVIKFKTIALRDLYDMMKDNTDKDIRLFLTLAENGNLNMSLDIDAFIDYVISDDMDTNYKAYEIYMESSLQERITLLTSLSNFYKKNREQVATTLYKVGLSDIAYNDILKYTKK